jgi:thiol:disulfide interchange protein DsbA
MRRIPLFCLVVLLSCFGSSAARAELVLGKTYEVLAPAQPVETGDAIEVVEVFYFGCPHCYDAENSIGPWLKRLPADVTFRRMPAVFRSTWEPLARTYYTLLAVGEADRLVRPIFDTIHLDGLALSQEKVMADYAARNGIDRERWLSIYRSQEIGLKVLQARDQAIRYKVQGVPHYVVDGKYITSNIMAGGHDEAMVVINELIEKARRERAK